jgi:hypothetical protein
MKFLIKIINYLVLLLNNERIAQFKHDSNSLIRNKSMELTEKNGKTKEFYLYLKKDYIKFLRIERNI